MAAASRLQAEADELLRRSGDGAGRLRALVESARHESARRPPGRPSRAAAPSHAVCELPTLADLLEAAAAPMHAPVPAQSLVRGQVESHTHSGVLVRLTAAWPPGSIPDADDPLRNASSLRPPPLGLLHLSQAVPAGTLLPAAAGDDTAALSAAPPLLMPDGATVTAVVLSVHTGVHSGLHSRGSVHTSATAGSNAGNERPRIVLSVVTDECEASAARPFLGWTTGDDARRMSRLGRAGPGTAPNNVALPSVSSCGGCASSRLGASEPATRFGGVSWLTLTERLLENTPALGSASAWDAMRRQLGIKQNLSALEGALDADQLLVAFNAPPAGTHAAAASQQQTAAAVGAHTRGGPGDQLCSDQNWYSYSSRNGSSSGQNGSFSDQNGDCGQKVYSSHNGSSSQNKTKAPGACAPRVAPVAGARSDALHPSAGAINGRAVRGDLHPAGEGARGSSESRAGAGRGYAACRREQDALWASEAVAKGVAHAKRGRAVEALQAYDHALELSPLCVDALVAKGACLVTLARQREALSVLDTALRLDPSHPNAAQYRHTALRQLGVGHPQRPTSEPAAAGGRPAPPPALPSPMRTLQPWRLPPSAPQQDKENNASRPQDPPPRWQAAGPAHGNGEGQRDDARRGGAGASARGGAGSAGCGEMAGGAVGGGMAGAEGGRGVTCEAGVGTVASGAVDIVGPSLRDGGERRVAVLGQMVEALREERRRRKEAKKEKKRRKRSRRSEGERDAKSEKSGRSGKSEKCEHKASRSKQGKHKRRRLRVEGTAAGGSSDGREEGLGGGGRAASASGASEGRERGGTSALEGRAMGRAQGREEGRDARGASSYSSESGT